MACIARTYRIPSLTSEIYPVQKEILSVLAEEGFDENSIFAIRLAMDEALINAIKHGNKNDPEKFVELSFRCEEDRAVVSIQDEGDGFDHSHITDPRDEEGLNRTHGRGIFLIKQFMTEVAFNDKGNHITFTFVKGHDSSKSLEGMRVWLCRGIAIVELDPEIGLLEVDDLRHQFERLIREGHSRIIVDLRRLDYINSMVLSTFVAAMKLVQEVNGRLKLVRPTPNVDRVLNATNLARILDVDSDLGMAISEMEKF